MKIFTSSDIREIDRKTVERDGITSWELMERAASLVTKEIMERWSPTQRIVVFAGPGNNGGDALAVSRMLIDQGYHPEIYLFNTKEHLSDDCKTNRDKLIEYEYEDFTEVVKTFSFPEITERDVIVDGIFGSGLRERIVGGYTSLVQNINESNAFVVSIDIPSGLFGEYNYENLMRNVVHADLTLTFQFPRLSFFFKENNEVLGEWKVLDIGLNRRAIHETPSNTFFIDSVGVRDAMSLRNPFADKNEFGRIYLAAGSHGMAGAAILAARAALRSGTGVVTVHTPGCAYLPLQTAVPEAIVDTDADDCVVTQIAPHKKSRAVGIGPGLGTDERTVEALGNFLRSRREPVVLDADALNCLAQRPMYLSNIPANSVITPNAHEFDRLFGDCYTEEERLKKALDAASRLKINIVLKGHYTKVIRPDGKIFINSTGNAGMATAGSGDVLTGIITSLLGQDLASCTAAVIGVFVHGLAGDLARKKHGEAGLIASDIVDNIGKAIKLILES